MLLCTAGLKAQDKKIILAFPITDYIIEQDSVSILQILVPEGVTIQLKSLGMLKKTYTQNDTSTATIGNGRCQLVKGRYHYYGFLQKNMTGKPSAGNLLYTYADKPDCLDGLLLEVIRHGITLLSVEEATIANLETVIGIKNKNEETAVLEKLVADVRYTGTEMIKQGVQDMEISSGSYKGKTIFKAMQVVNLSDVEDFLGYIKARPSKYAGNAWKFSEIMATWMHAGAPVALN